MICLLSSDIEIKLFNGIVVMESEQKNINDKILFVDDEIFILQSLKIVARKLNAEIYCASSAKEALDFLATTDVNIVVSDMSMPEINGIEFLSEVAERYPETIRIMMTGYGEAKVVLAALNQGRVWGFIEKPWDNQQLLQTLNQALSTHRLIFHRVNSLYRELALEKQKAEKALQAKSDFLAVMSHEIRTPMNVILGSLSILKNNWLDDEREAHLSNAEHAGKTMLALLNDVLEYSKIESGHLTLENISFNPIELIQATVNIFSTKASQKGIQISCQFVDNIPTSIEADPQRLRQILINLCSNAIKFTEKGYIKVQVSGQSEKALRIDVEDTGIGIPKEKQAELFDKFVQVDSSYTRSYEGSGLGLAICKQLINAMGGEISLSSELGKGSCFSITIPLRDDLIPEIEQTTPSFDEAVSDSSEKKLEQLLRNKSLDVLLVEDSPSNQLVAQTMLESFGFNVDIANNGKEGVMAVEAKDYQLILMDLSMPVMDGAQATQKIIAMAKPKCDVPIIAMTANLMQEDLEYCYRSGMQAHIAKPVDRDNMIQVISKILLSNEQLLNQSDTPTKCYTLLNLETLNNLRQDTSSEALPKIIQYFVDETNSRIERVLTAINAENWDAVKQEAHALKSSAGTIGAVQLQQKSKELELACFNQEFSFCTAMSQKISQIATESLNQLTKYYKDIERKNE